MTEIKKTIYPYRFIRKSGKPHSADLWLETHEYDFIAKSKCRYLVEVERYQHHVYALKFYTEQYAKAKHKYNVMTSNFEGRGVIHTCIDIFQVEFLRKNPLASLAFVGAPQEGESITETKRFRVYRLFMLREFNPENFEHQQLGEKSAYIVYNKKNYPNTPITVIEQTLGGMFEL